MLHCKLGAGSGNAELFESLSIALEITPQGKPSHFQICPSGEGGMSEPLQEKGDKCRHIESVRLFHVIASRVCHHIFFHLDLNFPSLLGSERF